MAYIRKKTYRKEDTKTLKKKKKQKKKKKNCPFAMLYIFLIPIMAFVPVWRHTKPFAQIDRKPGRMRHVLRIMGNFQKE